MQKSILPILRCPLSGTRLELMDFSAPGNSIEIIEGIMLSNAGPAFPILEGIPRMLPDAMIEHADFLRQHLPDFDQRMASITARYGGEMRLATSKNHKTRLSFSREWAAFDYESGKTWNLDVPGLLAQFFRETGETTESIRGKKVLDAGCGNGQLSMELANIGAEVFAMDFSAAVLQAAQRNISGNCHFIQGDVEYPPFEKQAFSLIYSSGVLIHTRNTRSSFQRLAEFVADGGKISIWVYRKREEMLHRFFNRLRQQTAAMPAWLQIPFLRYVIFHPALWLKRWKGDRQSSSELWIEVLDWFTPEFRHEHSREEVISWFREATFNNALVTDENHWGFSVSGTRQVSEPE